ncbi:MAG: flagellar protein FliO/FliZ [Halothiobacillaceae bacterium]|nr:MAG: flagellar protein FliO/FliZ [Halothiobacillaceae bacterium]
MIRLTDVTGSTKRVIKLDNKRVPRRLNTITAMVMALLYAVAVQGETLPEPIKKSAVTEPAGLNHLVEGTLGLIAVLAAIFLVAWLAKRYGSFNTTVGGALRVVGGLSVGQRERVVLIQVGDKQLLLGVAPGRVVLLQELSEPLQAELSASSRVAGESFAERLQAALNQRLRS